MKYKIINEGVKNQFHYSGVDYSYDSYECSDMNCGCRDNSDYCRSSQYKGLRVSKIDLNSIRFHFLEKSNSRKDIQSVTDTPFIHYCVDRLLRIHKVFDNDLWDITTCHGYYGDEINSITFNGFDSLVSDIKEVLLLPENKQVPFVLKKEYDFILDSLKNKSFSILKVDINDIVIGNKEYKKKVCVRDYYFDESLPVGVFLKEGGKYRLIDGYHRYCLLKTNTKKINIIAAI